VAELSPGRPVPEHVTVYFWAALPWSMTVEDPEVASDPDQAPLAVQDVAFELDQVSVALCPGMTAAGLMETRATALGGGGVTGAVVPPLQPERTKAETRKRPRTT
jgi:hypothetical protein